MIPQLIEEITTTIHGGIPLNDVLSCFVTEERNGSYELKMVVSKDDLWFYLIDIGKYIYAKPNELDDPQPFRIYRITKPSNGKVTVYAEHFSNRLLQTPVKAFSVSGATAEQAMNAMKTNSLIDNPFTFTSDVTTVSNYSVDVPSAFKTKLVGTQGSILQVYGGEYKYNGFNIALMASRGEDTGIRLTYAKNITALTNDETLTNVYTGIAPFWKGQNDDQEVIVLPTSPVIYASNHADFPYERVIPVDFSQKIDHIPTPSELQSAAEAYVVNNKISEPNSTFDVSFVPLWQAKGYEELAEIERVSLCDIVTVYYPSLGISAKAKVVKTEYNVLTERYNKITIGTTKTSFTERLASDINSAASTGGSGSGGSVSQARVLKVSLSNFSTLPQTITNAAITAAHEVLHAVLSNPNAQADDWTVATSAGGLTVSGTINGTTNLTLYLTEPTT